MPCFLRRNNVVEEFSEAHIAETSSGKETLHAIHTQQWDVLILDIHFPDINGLDILKEVKTVQPTLPVVILSPPITLL